MYLNISQMESLNAGLQRAIQKLYDIPHDALTVGLDKEWIKQHAVLPLGEVEEILCKGTTDQVAVLESETKMDYVLSELRELRRQLEGLRKLCNGDGR